VKFLDIRGEDYTALTFEEEIIYKIMILPSIIISML